MENMTFHIVRYENSMERQWNEFVASSRNSTFLFDRRYMDYHSDRFADCSWMVWKGGRLMALLPANVTPDRILHSHGGLTYGGWILPQSHIDGADVLKLFTEAIKVWKKENLQGLDYKTIPFFYASMPSQEDEYALFRLGGRLSQCGLSSTINLRYPGRLNQLQRRHLAKTDPLSLEIKKTDDIEAFMSMLGDCLLERHSVVPVHTPEEMRLLASRFPDNIKFHVVTFEGRIHAGVCIYDTGRIAHAQYIATTAEGRRLNLLTPLFHRLITETYYKRDFFDFGISTEDGGQWLNEGLLRQKSSFGATGTVYKRFYLPF